MCVYCCCFKKTRNFPAHILNQRGVAEALDTSRNPNYPTSNQTQHNNQQNHIIYVQPNTASAEPPQKPDTDLPPSYDDVIKKPT
jgi:hypothetical protein